MKRKDIRKQFALKIVPRSMKGSQYLKETESKVFHELPQHPFIISRENYFMNDKYHYFLSEFVESKNLDQCLVVSTRLDPIREIFILTMPRAFRAEFMNGANLTSKLYGFGLQKWR